MIRSWAQFPGNIPLPDANRIGARNEPAARVGPWRVRSERLPGGQSLQATVSEQTPLASLSSYRQSVGLTVLLAWWLTGPSL